MVSKHRHAFLTLLKNKGSKEERMTKVGRSSWIPGFMFQCCLTLQRYLMGYLTKASFPVREIGTVMTLLHACHVLEHLILMEDFEGQDHFQ